MATIVTDYLLTSLIPSDDRQQRYLEIIDWLIENVGPSTHVGNRHGTGWKRYPRINDTNGQLEWCIDIDDDTLAVMFKLKFV
jgi:hypothetical protein